MKLLVIAYKFSPFPGVGARRLTSLVGEFAQLGHTVDVLTVKWAGDVDNTLVHENITLHEVKSNYLHLFHYSSECSSNFFCRLFRKIYVTFFRFFLCWDDEAQIWGRNLIPAAENIIKKTKIDAIIATGHPFQSNYLASLIKKEHPDIKLIQDFRDPWISSWSVHLFKHRIRRFKKMRIDACAEADLIVTVTDHLCEFYSGLLPRQTPPPLIKLIPNGYEENAILSALRRSDRTPRADALQDKIVVTHIGNISNGRDEAFKIFLQAIEQMRPAIKSKLVFNFAGYIPRSSIRDNAKVLSNLSFSYFGQIPFKQALDLAAQADFVLHFGSRQFVDARSTKIYEYAAMKRTLISLNFGGELEEFIKKFSIGHSINLAADTSITPILERCFSTDDRFDFSVQEFSYRKLAATYINEIERVVC